MMLLLLLLIPTLIVLTGMGLYAAFTNRFLLIVLVGIGLLCVFNSFHQWGMEAQMAQARKDVQTHRDQWALEDARWAKQHH